MKFVFLEQVPLGPFLLLTPIFSPLHPNYRLEVGKSPTTHTHTWVHMHAPQAEVAEPWPHPSQDTLSPVSAGPVPVKSDSLVGEPAISGPTQLDLMPGAPTSPFPGPTSVLAADSSMQTLGNFKYSSPSRTHLTPSGPATPPTLPDSTEAP